MNKKVQSDFPKMVQMADAYTSDSRPRTIQISDSIITVLDSVFCTHFQKLSTERKMLISGSQSELKRIQFPVEVDGSMQIW